LICRDDISESKYVDVINLQGDLENLNGTFQAASNFNGVEGISEYKTPDSETFTEDYIYDRTQGPAASLGAPGAAITRVHAAFYNKNGDPFEWRQTGVKQIEFLDQVSEHFPTINGYVIQDPDKQPEFPKEGTDEYDKLLDITKIGIHKDVQIVFGQRGFRFRPLGRTDQYVDQVFCAAMNMRQGMSGQRNSRISNAREKALFILRSAYYGSYLAAVVNKRKKLYLTMIGGGVFGNEKSDIWKAICEAHSLIAGDSVSELEEVNVILWSSNDYGGNIKEHFKKLKVPMQFIKYIDNVRTVVDQYDPEKDVDEVEPKKEEIKEEKKEERREEKKEIEESKL